MKCTATDTFRAVGRRIWSATCATLARRAREQNSALFAAARAGKKPPRDPALPTNRQLREQFAQVCTGCGQRNLPPGRPGRQCEACRRPRACQGTPAIPA